MESDEGKLFVGGITYDTTDETLRDYFSKYGDVTNAVVMRDKNTGRPRGFGFVMFSDPSAIDSLLQDKHTIDGRLVEAKRALSREEQSAFKQDPSNGSRGSGGGGNFRTKKIFVGGLPPTLTEDGFRQYFESFGQVTDAVIMYDQSTQRPRGFGFISFDTEDAVDRVLQKTFHDLNGKDVEVKRALPKEANPASGNRGGGYQSYGSSRGNSGSYDNRMDGNRYMQPQSGGFSSYPGYNATGYGGYGGPAGSYGGYGGYGYGAGAGGFAGPAGAYGGSNATGAGYGSGPANAMKAAWCNQTTGYGSSGYGAGYGPSAGWGSAAGSGASAQTGQSPAGGPGYGNQAYGGGYGGSGYGASGYGAVGGRAGSGATGNADGGDQSAAGGYGGYNENNRNSGYGTSGWRSDPSQGAGGYGDTQSWQGQQ